MTASSRPLDDWLAAAAPQDAAATLAVFEEWLGAERGISLYPAQEEAIFELAAGSNVILSTPTGSGKSLVALAAHVFALTAGERTVYTAPIKALVSEKFFELTRELGADRVGMVTGDTSINPDAPVLCCTAEILAHIALGDSAARDIKQVVMDEFHYYGDFERGWAWQVPLLLMPQAQFLLLSATLGDVTELAADLSRRTGRETAQVTGAERPVPLSFEYAVQPLHELVERLRDDGLLPAYIVSFQQAQAVETAQALSSIRLLGRDERDAIAREIGDFRFLAGFGQTLSRLVRSGIGVHHAGMLPRYRRLVERLAQRGLLRVICGTDTLGVGINVPIRTVVLTQLTKFDGNRMRRLQVREFQQIAGRAGRAGFDTAGTVVVLAPPHEVENARAQAKAARQQAAGRKAKPVRKKQVPADFVAWDENTMHKLSAGQPETLRSHMRITHQMLLNVIGRGETHEGDALRVLQTLIFDSHEPRERQFALARRALEMFRTLRAGGVVRVREERGERLLELEAPLQQNFALDQPLSPFALAAIELLDPAAESYALDVISVVEATLEKPFAILRAQLQQEKARVVAELKADGVEYEERMQILDEVTYPQPLAELLAEAFAEYVGAVPWARDYEISPKSIVRDMVERALNFREYITHYGLARAEGVLLRYLSEVYRALSRTVPPSAHTPQLTELIEWLGETVRQVDNTLVAEWEQLAGVGGSAAVSAGEDALALAAPPAAVIHNTPAFMVMLRNALFRRVEAAAFERMDVLRELDGQTFGEAAWDAALDGFYAEHSEIRVDAAARSPQLLSVRREADGAAAGTWEVRQVLLDDAGDMDWGIEATVDLAASADAGEPVVSVTAVRALA